MTEPGVPNGDPTLPPTAEVAAPVAIPMEAEAASAPTSAANGAPLAASGLTESSPLTESEPAEEHARVPLVEAPSPLQRARSAGRSRRAPTIPAIELPEPAAETPAPEPAAPAPAAILVAPTSAAAPVAIPAPSAPVATLAPTNGPAASESLDERLRRLETVLVKLADVKPAPAPVAVVAPPVATVAAATAQPGRSLMPSLLKRVLFGSPGSAGSLTADARQPWLLRDMLSDLRSIRHMYGDPRFQVSASGWIVPPLMLVLIFTSWFWLPGTTIIPGASFIDKALDLALSFILFKVVFREARRYRDTVPQ